MNSDNMEISLHQKDYQHMCIDYPSMSATVLKFVDVGVYEDSFGKRYFLTPLLLEDKLDLKQLKLYVFRIDELDKVHNKFFKAIAEDILITAEFEFVKMSTMYENFISLAGNSKDADILNLVKLDIDLMRQRMRYMKKYHNFVHNRIPVSETSKYNGRRIEVLTASGEFLNATIEDGHVVFTDHDNSMEIIRYFVLTE